MHQPPSLVHQNENTMLKIIAVLLIFALPIVSCSKEEEHFEIGVSYNKNSPQLNYCYLKMQDFHADEPFNSLGKSLSLHSIKIPEIVELSWQAENETLIHTQTLPVRSNIPKWVLNKLQDTEIKYIIDISIFIIHNNPSFCWSLDALPKIPGKQHKHIAHSENCPWLDYLNQFKK